jgi:hypothetical protein
MGSGEKPRARGSGAQGLGPWFLYFVFFHSVGAQGLGWGKAWSQGVWGLGPRA